MGEYSGKTTLVTGGGSGIGRALAEALAAEGARVAITDIDEAPAEQAAAAIRAAGGEARSFAHDVTNSEQWAEVVGQAEAALGPIEVLCSNAGSAGCGQELTNMPVDLLRWVFEVNVFSAARAISAVVPGMKARGRGQVLFTGSVASFAAFPTNADYAGSKHALLAIADTLRQELDGTGIGVSLLCPGPVETRILETSHNLAEAGTGLTFAARDMSHPAMAKRVKESGGRLTPGLVAGLALEGMRAGQFLIFTHQADRKPVSARIPEIDAAFTRVAS